MCCSFQAVKVAIMVAFGVLVLLTRQRKHRSAYYSLTTPSILKHWHEIIILYIMAAKTRKQKQKNW